MKAYGDRKDRKFSKIFESIDDVATINGAVEFKKKYAMKSNLMS